MLSSRSLLKGLAVTSAAVVITAAGGAAAFADDISNNLDSSIDAVAEVMALNVGGSNGTTTLYVNPTNGDGKNGCNLTGSTTLVVSVSSSNTAVATVSPSSLTFTSCGDTKTLTVTPVAQGSATVSLAQSSNNSGGSFNLAGATFTVNLAPPANTAPTVAVTGVTGGDSYEIGTVPPATCEVTDTEDGNSTFTATLSDVTGPLAAYGLGSQTASCSYTDAGGLTASSSANYAIVDTTGPALSLPVDITAEATGPTGAVVTFSATATDSGAGPATPDVTCSPASGSTFPVTTTTVHCSAKDVADNTSSGTFTVTVRDTTAPTVTVPANMTEEATGPSGATVTFSATASDLVTQGLAPTCSPASGSTFGLTTTTVTCTATDEAGNTGSNSFTVTVRDTTAPVVTVPDNQTVEATGPSGAVVTFEATAEDAVGPLHPAVTCTPASGSTFALGTHTVTCTATDDHDNEGTAGFTITVQDTTAPTVTAPGDVTAEATGPDGAVVTYGSATASDIVSGELPATCAPASGSTFALGATEVVCSAIDDAGNLGTASFTVTVEDTTPPAITWVGGPQDGASYVFGSVPAAGTCTAVDLVSGAVDCIVSGYSAAVGDHKVTATATDGAGNTASESRTYSVLAWSLKGFYSPVDMNGVWNTVKGGSTVPLKFEVFAGSTELSATSAIQGFTVKGVSCPTTGLLVDDIELTTTGGTSLRYDSTAGQFVQNWQTPKNPGACYKVTMTTQDGSSLSANFKLK